jgi:hypothetical protein
VAGHTQQPVLQQQQQHQQQTAAASSAGKRRSQFEQAVTVRKKPLVVPAVKSAAKFQQHKHKEGTHHMRHNWHRPVVGFSCSPAAARRWRGGRARNMLCGSDNGAGCPSKGHPMLAVPCS